MSYNCKLCNTKVDSVWSTTNWGWIKWRSPLGQFEIRLICPECSIKLDKKIKELIIKGKEVKKQ